MRPIPHPRSYEGVKYLARVRCMTVGVEYAEAFEIVKEDMEVTSGKNITQIELVMRWENWRK
jgi:hypothetical protein